MAFVQLSVVFVTPATKRKLWRRSAPESEQEGYLTLSLDGTWLLAAFNESEQTVRLEIQPIGAKSRRAVQIVRVSHDDYLKLHDKINELNLFASIVDRRNRLN